MAETDNKMNDSRFFTSKRPHLTKEERLPKCYKDVEKIIKSVQSCRNNFKTVMASSRLRGPHFKKVYSLSLNVLKYYNYIQKIIDMTEILIKETFLRREITSILIYELIYGKGYLPGRSKVVTIIQAYQSAILEVHQELQSNTDACELNVLGIYIPRYVRVHTLKTTVAYVIKDFESYGFKQIMYKENISEENYLELVRNLERGTFIVDFHFKDILVFAQDENLIELDLYKNGHIFLQDKASYIPVHVLNPEPGSTVLDACAAPGMKSAHIASQMENKGTLIACERDKTRFEILKETFEYGSVKIAKTLCTDFKLVDPNDEAYASVEYILLDPSCSGSGMVNRMDEVTNNEDSTSKGRIQKLAGFQIVLLKHALKFPSVKRVVYSTCSIHEEENEYVVHEALSAFGNSFKLVPVLPEWFSRGTGNYQYNEMCLRTVPQKHLTNGFFVALFERIESFEYKDKYSKRCKKFKSSRDDSEIIYSPDRKWKHFSDRKDKSKGAFKQEEESYEFKGLNENVEDSLKFDGSKERYCHSNNYKDTNVENVTECKSHRKKNKKSKYLEHTNIEEDKEQKVNNHHCKTEEPSNNFVDSFSNNSETNVVHNSINFQMSSELDNIVSERKKSKHKKSHRHERNSDITAESSELMSEHKSKKKKKRKHSETASNDGIAPLGVQNNVTKSNVSDVLQTSNSRDSLNDNNIEGTANFIAEEEIELENSPPKKHKKKKKKKEREVEGNSELLNYNDVHPSDAQNLRHSNEVVDFSSQENSNLSQTRNINFDDNDLKRTKSKKHKHKKHVKKSDYDVSIENFNSSFTVTVTKETNHVDDGNTLEAISDENNFQVKKRTKRKSKKGNTEEGLNDYNTSSQNIDLEQEVSKTLLRNELDTVSDNVQNEIPKRKKSKKHKHSKDEV